MLLGLATQLKAERAMPGSQPRLGAGDVCVGAMRGLQEVERWVLGVW